MLRRTLLCRTLLYRTGPLRRGRVRYAAKHMVKRFVCFVVACALGTAAETVTVTSLIEMSRNPGSGEFRKALAEVFKEADLQKGVAWMGHGPDFFWAVDSASAPTLFVDDARGPAMTQVPGTNLWFASGQVRPLGKSHAFHYVMNGQRFGGRLDMPAFTPDSYAQPGVPQGKLSGKMTFVSKIYDGMQSDYWIYVPSQYDSKTPAALMVFQDGQGYINRDSPTTRILDVLDNLIAQKKIPVMIGVFISPGKISGAPGTSTYNYVKAYSEKTHRELEDSMRSVEYDTVSDRYARFLRDEILAETGSKYNLRRDGYSRGITGLSSGGICAFNVAWQQPDQFSRVISWIGSFTALQWHPGEIDGGNVYPNKVRLEPKRNIRVWMQDGSEDLENPWGSWPLQNVQLANSLKMREYDFHFSFGRGTHNPAHGSAEFPQEMTWLWRDYDPAKTEQTYSMEPGEKSKPLFRIRDLNRSE